MRSLKEDTEGEEQRRGQTQNAGDLQALFKFRQNKKPRRQKDGQKCAMKDKNGASREVVIHSIEEKLYLRGRKKNKS